MKKTNNIIKINGRHYDANTGDALTSFGSTISDIKPMPHSRHASSVKAPRVEPHKPRLSNDIRRVAKTVHSHAPQPSKTLMRGALKKPLPTHKSILKSQGTIDSLVRQPNNVVLTKLSVSKIDNKRLKHALVIPKSKLISHFNGNFLEPSPELKVQTPLTPVIADIKPSKLEGTAKPDFLQAAIDRATSHQQPAYKPPKSRHLKLAKRIAKITGTTVVVLIVVGIVGYRNITSLQMRMASSKAGFSASLPAYKPIGFKLDTISSNVGEVAVKFISQQDISNNFTLTEKPSTLNSASLRDSFVSVKDKNYQTTVVKGQTVYLYGGNSATWVNGDVWYIITGNGSLSNAQILKLVTSV